MGCDTASHIKLPLSFQLTVAVGSCQLTFLDITAQRLTIETILDKAEIATNTTFITKHMSDYRYFVLNPSLIDLKN